MTRRALMVAANWFSSHNNHLWQSNSRGGTIFLVIFTKFALKNVGDSNTCTEGGAKYLAPDQTRRRASAVWARDHAPVGRINVPIGRSSLFAGGSYENCGAQSGWQRPGHP